MFDSSCSVCICLSVCLSVCLSLCLSVCPSVCLSACLPFCLSAYLSVCLYFCLYVSVCVCLWVSVCPVCASSHSVSRYARELRSRAPLRPPVGLMSVSVANFPRMIMRNINASVLQLRVFYALFMQSINFGSHFDDMF